MVTGKCTDVFRGIVLVWEGELRWGVLVGGSFHGKTSHGKRNPSMKGAQDFLELFKKNNEIINMKSFFLLKVRSSIKT